MPERQHQLGARQGVLKGTVPAALYQPEVTTRRGQSGLAPRGVIGGTGQVESLAKPLQGIDERGRPGLTDVAPTGTIKKGQVERSVVKDGNSSPDSGQQRP